MNSKPDISVVIPAYNAAGTIDRCLAALSRQSAGRHLLEVIVVDDGSTDDTGARAARHGAHVIRKERGRPAAARNAGIAAARGEIICFTDADCEPQPDWLEELVAPLYEEEAIIGSKGIYRTRQRSLVARFVQLEYEEKYEKLRGRERIDFIDTYSAAYRKEVLVANDGFDERFPVSEDRELAYRLAARGYEMVFCPRAVVYHLHSATLGDYFRKKIRIGYWVAQTLLRFPAQGVSDSYTPQSMKVQVALMALLLLSLLLPPLQPWLALIPLALLALFLATTLPFLRHAWSRDRAVAVAAPLLLLSRALALGLGYAYGLVAPQRDVEAGADAIGGARYVAKRIMDVVAGAAGTVLWLTLLPFLYLSRRGEENRPLLATAECVGQRGTLFRRYYFCPPAGDPHPLWRRFPLRDLPAFWNVLRGDMSLVGPEAATPAEISRYTDRQRRRLSIKPGLTGPVQIDDGRLRTAEERVARELAYIESYSLHNDLRLIWQTLRRLRHAIHA
jgi:glycosyltransferase involved in cell wall biosynthesis/lipopolysaccharide/colanic/teichoic acid biosynthesis glycosyltransferase